MFDFIGNAFDGVVNTAKDFIEDPVGQSIYHATSPLRNGLDVLEGLTEGEIRVLAAAKLGADVVSGMAMSEVLDALSDVL